MKSPKKIIHEADQIYDNDNHIQLYSQGFLEVLTRDIDSPKSGETNDQDPNRQDISKEE